MKRIAAVLAVLLVSVVMLSIATGYTRDITGDLRRDAATGIQACLVALEALITNSDTGTGDTTAIKAALEADGWTVATKAINVAAGARTALVTTAGEGKKIRVLGLMGTADVSGSITLESASTAISGVIELAAKGGVVLPAIPAQNVALHGWCETDDNEALNITTVTCTFDGMLIYATED